MMALRLSLLLACLISLSPSLARALSDDGGLRSVFALGAGNRALAMGGAYGAIADDASAALWNPAGLAALDRRRFETSHTNLFGLGFSEQYVSFALPHWRWGNTSLTLRMFGTGGIEGRDDRNLLTADDLEDRETEILLAHGREMRPGMMVGGGLKIQRHELAGYSGSGVGLDAGVLIQPLVLGGNVSSEAAAWTVGLSIRNLVEPKVRLDLESVPDPRAWRLGSAWNRSLGTELEALVSLDFEKTAGMDARTHLGLETDYRDQAALRLGVLAGHLTAGFGIKWRDIEINFAFEDHRLGTVKRLGVNLLQGPSIHDIREEKLTAQERERRRKLEDAFAETDRQRRRDILISAREALAVGDHDVASDRISMLLVLAPENVEALELRNEILHVKAGVEEDSGDLPSAMVTLGRLLTLDPADADARSGLERLKSLSAVQTERSREIQQLYSAGLDAFAADDLDVALQNFTLALELAPDDADVSAMIERVERARVQRQDIQIDEVRSLARAGLVDEAGRALAKLQSLAADPGILGELEEVISVARRQMEYDQEHRRQARQRDAEIASLTGSTQGTASKAEVKKEATGISRAKRAELDQLTGRARALHTEGKVVEAVRVWELILAEDSHHAEAGAALREEYLSRGMEHFSAGRLQDAVAIWEEALRVDPEDQRTRSYLQRGRQQIARIHRLQQDAGQ